MPDKTILVVDDEAPVLDLLREILSSHWNVIEASDGVEALNKLRNGNRVHLVVSDVAMPNMNGPDFYRASRAEGIGVPFLFLSGNPINLPEGVPFIQKPFSVVQLIKTVIAELEKVQ